MNGPSEVDSLPSAPNDPPGWHVRVKTDDGYPLMGSSPAERQEAAQRGERLRLQAMRSHVFVGDGQYCERWNGPVHVGDPATTGVVAMRVMCSYGRDLHPLTTEEYKAMVQRRAELQRLEDWNEALRDDARRRTAGQ